jgi:hypothetical protein
MTLYDWLSRLLATKEPKSKSQTGDVCVGFVTPEERWSIKSAGQKLEIVNGIEVAYFVFQGPLEAFENLLAPSKKTDVDPAESLKQLCILPPNYLGNLGQLMQEELGLVINIDTLAAKDQPFSMPLRYPVGENMLLSRQYRPQHLPQYDGEKLPQLVVGGHPEWVEMYDKAWQLAFGNLRQPEPESGFVANFIDTAFNDNTFMWDSVFMTLFGRYGRRMFDFMGTLDNFYGKQHADGYICREINTYKGHDLFRPQDARSTGPNVMAWAEWSDFQLSGNVERLRAVFPALMAYYLWWKDWRTWPDGSYWTSGLGSGMDNQTRVPDSHWHHRHHAWADATMQQALNSRLLLRMAEIINRHDFDALLEAEYAHLDDVVNTLMWDEATGFYYDVAPDGTRVKTMSIGAYWGLFAGVIPENRAKRMVAHLDNPVLFNRPHRIPSQAANSPNGGYKDDGCYWLGGVWAPTNYMVLQALTERNDDDLAYAIARNHLENVCEVFHETGTLWENYAPECASEGNPARGDFVGWTGLSAISIPIEYLVGLRPQTARNRLLWDVRLVERHGVKNYPLGENNTVDLICDERDDDMVAPVLNIRTDDPFTLEVRWHDHRVVVQVAPGSHCLELSAE